MPLRRPLTPAPTPSNTKPVPCGHDPHSGVTHRRPCPPPLGLRVVPDAHLRSAGGPSQPPIQMAGVGTLEGLDAAIHAKATVQSPVIDGPSSRRQPGLRPRGGPHRLKVSSCTDRYRYCQGRREAPVPGMFGGSPAAGASMESPSPRPPLRGLFHARARGRRLSSVGSNESTRRVHRFPNGQSSVGQHSLEQPLASTANRPIAAVDSANYEPLPKMHCGSSIRSR
ncbi:hypothetical protein J2X58_000631 [Luteibacter sp. 3190]|nr:hypothetical protein [Luteibacter sp. 3190]